MFYLGRSKSISRTLGSSNQNQQVQPVHVTPVLKAFVRLEADPMQSVTSIGLYCVGFNYKHGQTV